MMINKRTSTLTGLILVPMTCINPASSTSFEKIEKYYVQRMTENLIKSHIIHCVLTALLAQGIDAGARIAPETIVFPENKNLPGFTIFTDTELTRFDARYIGYRYSRNLNFFETLIRLLSFSTDKIKKHKQPNYFASVLQKLCSWI